MDKKHIKDQYNKEIEQIMVEAKDRIATLESQRDMILQKFEIIEKYKKKKPKTESEFRELSSILCFGSISFCCACNDNPYGTGKPCPWRDSFLNILGITKENFFKFKSEMDNNVFKEFV